MPLLSGLEVVAFHITHPSRVVGWLRPGGRNQLSFGAGLGYRTKPNRCRLRRSGYDMGRLAGRDRPRVVEAAPLREKPVTGD
jgi:hypothetical protein